MWGKFVWKLNENVNSYLTTTTATTTAELPLTLMPRDPCTCLSLTFPTLFLRLLENQGPLWADPHKRYSFLCSLYHLITTRLSCRQSLHVVWCNVHWTSITFPKSSHPFLVTIHFDHFGRLNFQETFNAMPNIRVYLMSTSYFHKATKVLQWLKLRLFSCFSW